MHIKKIILTVIVYFLTIVVNAQNYTLNDLESQLLLRNGELIANKYNISIEEALIIQEKLWQNPSLSIKEINFIKDFTSDDKRFTVELEQLIETAKKRKNRIAIQELSRNSALIDYEELLRELLRELRITHSTLERIKKEEIQLITVVDLFKNLSEQYNRQANLKNVPKADYYRIQTELIGYEKELIDLENQKYETLNQLRILTFNPTIEFDQLVFDSSQENLVNLIPINVLDLAKEQNIGLKRQANEISIARKVYDLEKSQRIPDLTLGVNYDRGPRNIRDIIGVGVTFDLPVFNRNKGNIKAAQLGIDQQVSNQKVLENNLYQSIDQLENQLKRIDKMLDNWSKTNNTEEQIKLIENYKKHLHNKQVNLLEFLDFTEAFRQANQAYLELEEAYRNTFHELQYLVGKDF